MGYMENSENSKETTVSAPKAYVEVFDYPDSKTGEIKRRSLLVLNKDSTRLGGVDLDTVPEDMLQAFFDQMREKVVTDFSRKPKQELKEGEVPPPHYGMYKAFSTSKIIPAKDVKETKFDKYLNPETAQE